MEEEKEKEEENNKLNNSSEYTHLNELFKGKQQQQLEQQQPSTSGENNNFRYSFKNGGDEVSVAGTDFNEPWDSNAWENLLEIAKFGDAKTEIPLLSEKPRRRRSSCDTSSISSDGSTWRRSSPSSEDDNNDLEYLNKKKENENKKENLEEEKENNSTDDDFNVAEEAVAMAVVLAGNGTLPNRKKPRPMEWLCEEELLENEEEEGEEEENKISTTNQQQKHQLLLPQNSSLDTLILIEQAAKAANSSRCNMPSQRVRWTARNSREASTSLLDIPSSSSLQTENQQNIPQKDDKFDSMEEFNGESSVGHRRSERRLRAMMERSIGEHQTQNIHQSAFPSVAAYSASMDELGSQHSRTGSICPSITPVLSPSRLRNASQESQGEKDPALVIQQYVETLSTDDSTVFGATLQRFVECTLLSREQDPYVVVRRVRQFLNGIKNYLVKNGEADLHLIIERESDRLHADEFLNIDAILESVLNKILLVRIKAQLYRLMIMENTRNGELGKLTENLSLVRAMNAEELGFPEDTVLPDNIRMESINKQLRKMQNHYSPLKKLQLLLRALALAVPHLPLLSSSELQRQQQQQSFVATQPSNSSVFLSPIAQTSNSIGAGCGRLRTNSGSSSSGAMAAALKHPPADELIRWLVYLLARSSTINCEIEAWYMWELLPQQVLSTGDASYFLSILFSAVHVIKHPEIVKRLKNISLMPGRHPLPNIADFLGSQSTLQDVDDFANNNSDLLLRVAIPNEQEGSIEYHTFPVLPKMNASKLCRVIAHQFSVSNPEDYGLYVLFDGYETVLSPDEFPHLVRDNMIQSGKGHLFAYKRSETRIAWPKQAFSNFGTSTTIHTEKKILVEPPKNVNIHHHQQPQHQPQSSSSSSRLTSSSSGKGGRIKAVASSSNNRLANKNNNNMLFNIGMHA
uniref:Uncharacterized protein n=3 Tax=Meloidogyne TaxID=189290 RepID=A0A6V7XQP0_MELEN|nr:unnamed protein product [Meloidogyne enterolobii]